mmetsp:Transcript_15185/g.33228  ORF Transcript_15185/g.33228 Transcript_15185/m.33228 type:complete len:557 (+) Transcript_15185:183-1853(+)
MATSDSGTDNGPKIGRKGDPRMHRALAARLDSPDLSLFEALKQGGFDYINDDDPNAVDSENITLGQRKNQLSRRLRLAKKEGHTAEQFRSVADAGMAERRHSKQAAKQAVKRPGNFPGKKLALKKRQVQAEDEEDEEPPMGVAGTSISALHEQLAAQEAPQLAAKFHPDFQHIIIPRAGNVALPNKILQKSQNTPGAAAAAAAAAASVTAATSPGFLASQQRNQYNLQDQLVGSGFLGGLSGFNLPGSQAQSSLTMPPPSASNVAVRSLTSTAKSVGLTLEQLALTLSTSKNLMKLLTDISGTGGDDEEDDSKKHDLALRLHEYEAKTLSSRCMLLAGYNHDVAQEGTPAQLRFALEAWQNEGKRLQELLRSSKDVSIDDSQLFLAETGGRKSSSPDDKHHHDHHQHYSQKHVHRLGAKSGGRPILHQPKNGPAHIDFVVGDKVECYGNTQPIQCRIGGVPAIWPSQFRCDELNCVDREKCVDAAAVVEEKCTVVDDAEKKKPGKAKVIDLNDIDLTSNEWNSDVNDEALMGLFGLGAGGKESTSSVTSELPEFGA